MPDRRAGRRYPRTARVNEVVREVVAEELERLVDVDEGVGLLTVTHVEVTPDLRRATVLLSSLPQGTEEALGEHRARLQAAIGRQVRLKRTPQLVFQADPAVAAGRRIDELLRGLDEPARQDDAGPEDADH